MGQRKKSDRQELNPWPPEHQAGAVSTELRELYSPRNDPDPEMIPTFLLVDPEMIPKELGNGN